MQTLSAAELARMIEQARAGSREALGQLLDLYRSYLRLIASLSTREQLQAKLSSSDIVQATFLQAHRNFQDFQGNSEGELISWLRKILAREWAMEVRRYSTQRRDVRVEREIIEQLDNSSDAVGAMLAAQVPSASENALRRESVVLLADALDQLPPHYREIIVMRHFHGQSFGEIAAKTHRTLDSVKSVWRRAIAEMRKRLEDRVF